MQQQAAHTGGQRREQRVVQPVGPAGIGGVPEHVVLTHVEAEVQVGVERRERPYRHGHALRGAGGAGGEQLHESAVPADGDRGTARIVRVVRGHQVGEAHSDAGGTALGVTCDDDLPGRVGGDVLARRELAHLVRVGDDDLRAAGLQPETDRRGCERGEQRHVHGTAAPDAEQRHDQVRGLAHQGGDVVARLDAEVGQGRGEAGGLLAQVTEGQIGRAQVRLDHRERDGVRGMPVAQQLCGTRVGGVVAVQQFPHSCLLPGMRTRGGLGGHRNSFPEGGVGVPTLPK